MIFSSTRLLEKILNQIHISYLPSFHKPSGPQLEKLMEQLRTDMASNPPLPGSYSPKRGDLCAAKYSDDEWYRAKIEKINKDNTINLLYIDYGNVIVTLLLKKTNFGIFDLI